MLDERLWTVDDVAAALRVSKWTVYAMVGKDEKLPDRRVGAQLRWRRSDLDDILGPATVGSVPPSALLPPKVRAQPKAKARGTKAKKSARTGR